MHYHNTQKNRSNDDVAVYAKAWNGSGFVEQVPGDASDGVGISFTGGVITGLAAAVDDGGHPFAAWGDQSDGMPESLLRGNLFDLSGSLHVAYTFSDWTVALGYAKEKDDGGASLAGTVFTVGGTLGIVDLAFFVAQDDSIAGDNTSYGLSGAIEVGAATQITGSVSDGDVGDTSYGLGVVHDLGGGVTILGMVGRATNRNNVADLGVKFNF